MQKLKLNPHSPRKFAFKQIIRDLILAITWRNYQSLLTNYQKIIIQYYFTEREVGILGLNRTVRAAASLVGFVGFQQRNLDPVGKTVDLAENITPGFWGLDS